MFFKILEKVGATVLPVVQTNRSLDLREILETLKKLELHSVMVEVSLMCLRGGCVTLKGDISPNCREARQSSNRSLRVSW
jgi:hypothetical protein